METKKDVDRAKKILPFLVYLEGMETISFLVFSTICFAFLVYLEGMETHLFFISQFLCLFVFSLPRRDGNGGFPLRYREADGVFSLPRRDGNRLSTMAFVSGWPVFSLPRRDGNTAGRWWITRQRAFLVYLEGMETEYLGYRIYFVP